MVYYVSDMKNVKLIILQIFLNKIYEKNYNYYFILVRY